MFLTRADDKSMYSWVWFLLALPGSSELLYPVVALLLLAFCTLFTHQCLQNVSMLTSLVPTQFSGKKNGPEKARHNHSFLQ